MLRDERKQNHTKCLIKIRKGRKRVEDKKETKKKGNRQKIVINMIHINLTISIITLNVNDLNKTIRRQGLSQWIKKARLNNRLFKGNSF